MSWAHRRSDISCERTQHIMSYIVRHAQHIHNSIHHKYHMCGPGKTNIIIVMIALILRAAPSGCICDRRPLCSAWRRRWLPSGLNKRVGVYHIIGAPPVRREASQPEICTIFIAPEYCRAFLCARWAPTRHTALTPHKFPVGPGDVLDARMKASVCVLLPIWYQYCMRRVYRYLLHSAHTLVACGCVAKHILGRILVMWWSLCATD